MIETSTRDIVIVLIILALVFFIIVYILNQCLNQMNQSFTDIQCCNGQTCSDTYYTPTDNLCHLSLCEQNEWINGLVKYNPNCTYQGLNKSITLLSK